MAKEIVKLSPLCLPDPKGKRPGRNGQKHVMPMAVNNRGYLRPCCWCDEKNITASKQFKPLNSAINFKFNLSFCRPFG